MENKSIFKRIFKNNIIFMTMLVTIMFVLLCVLLCKNYIDEKSAENHALLTEYAEEVLSVYESSMQLSNTILRYNYLIDGIDSEKKSTEEKYSFSKNTDNYLAAVENDYCKVRIYFSNENLYESRYMYKAEYLENMSYIQEVLKKEAYAFNENTETDLYGKQYFVFYRRIGINDGNILECKVAIPEAKNTHLSIMKTKEVPEKCISAKVYDGYSAVLENEAGQIVRGCINIIAAALFMALAVILLLAFLMYKQNTKIASGLEEFIELIDSTDVAYLEESNIAFEADADTDKELRVMKRIIYELILKVRDVSQQKYEIEFEKQNLEFTVLQSQIDPHTLYNSLSAIKYNAFIKNDEATMELVENMVMYYRAVLNSGKSVFTIDEELEMLKFYVRINELSQDTCYNLKVDVDEDIGKTEIIHLLLQPFVENAIVHGLIGRQNECSLCISCKKEGEYVIFTISDNGYGIKEEKLKKLKNIESYDESYGIKNAYHRMKLVYGEDSSIDIQSTAETGTTVKIKFRPAK